MVDSSGFRRRISRRTVRPPTPESKTPIGRGSVTAPSAPRRDGDAQAVDREEVARDAPHVLADLGRRVREDERHALVVRLDDEDPVRDDAVLRHPAYRPL